MPEVAARFARLEALLNRFVETEGVPGTALAVAVDDEIVFEHYAGLAAPGRAADPQTLWDLASIGKGYTAATIIALVERGELTFSRPVAAWLPACHGDGREQITLRHLLTHTSGLDGEAPEVLRLSDANAPLEAIVTAALNAPLCFQPGTDRRYSNIGSAVAAHVAALATGTPFPELLRTLVLDPAGLQNTFRPVPPAEAGRLAHVDGIPGGPVLEAAHPAG